MPNKTRVIGGHRSRCTKHASRNRDIIARLGEVGVVKKWSSSSGSGLQGFSLQSRKGKKATSLTQTDSSNPAVVDDNIEIEDHDVPPSLPELEEEPAYLERGQCKRMIPRRFQDYLPAACMAPLQQYAALRSHNPPVPSSPVVSTSQQSFNSHSSTPESIPPIDTKPNSFGLYQQYKTLLSFDPDDTVTIANLCDAPTFSVPPDSLQECSPLSVYGTHAIDATVLLPPDSNTTTLAGSWFAPFMNPSICQMMHWFYSMTTKNLNHLNHLVNEVILAPDFVASDLQNFDANQEAKCLDSNSLPMDGADGWFHDHVTLHLPQKDVCHDTEEDAPALDIPDVWH
ncbi:hypothetical protein F5146DRAFT_1137096 [Armillaria mellea]|nr:hypothetical protein F5146DRAFT_1137096 [Armillaria mellea]